MSNTVNMKRNGDSDRGRRTENSQGAGPATPRLPAPQASFDEMSLPAVESEAVEPDGATYEIECELRRRLGGLRMLRPGERAAGYRAAKNWYRLALMDL